MREKKIHWQRHRTDPYMPLCAVYIMITDVLRDRWRGARITLESSKVTCKNCKRMMRMNLLRGV